MRKRNIQILFRLTEEEAKHLSHLVEKSGHSRESLLRAMIAGYHLCEKPDESFYEYMRELSVIGGRVNQIAIKANALGFIDAPMINKEVERWKDFQLAIQKKFLLPVKEKKDGGV